MFISVPLRWLETKARHASRRVRVDDLQFASLRPLKRFRNFLLKLVKRSLNEVSGWFAYNRTVVVQQYGGAARPWGRRRSTQDEMNLNLVAFPLDKGAEFLHTDPTRTRESLNAKPSLLRLAAPLAALLVFHTLSRVLPYHVRGL